MTQPPQDNFLYFQMFGLTASAPDQLNLSLRRAIESLHQTLYSASSDDLSESDLALLERGGFDTRSRPESSDPMLEYATEFAAILETSLTPSEVAKLLGGISAVRVRQMIQDGSLLATQVEKRWHIPRFQFEKNRLVPNIGRVNEALSSTIDSVSALRWYTTPDPELETADDTFVSPLGWLKAGLDPAIPVKLAEDL